MRKKGARNLTYTQRLQLEACLRVGLHKQRIAEKLGVCLSTVYNEINRGTVNGIYDPKYAQEKYEQYKAMHGRKDTLLVDADLAQQISDLILNENISPEQAIKKLKAQNISCPSKTTIYAAIDKGLIPNVTREDLHSKTTTMFSHGLVQIPTWIRTKLNLQDDDTLAISLQNDKVIVEKIH